MIIYNGELDKVAYKDVFGRVMEEIATQDKDVVYLDADLMNSIGTHKFWQKNPKQAINVGIAEANMIGIAAGLSAGGKKPYVHTFGPFASRRCYDQVFLSVGYAGNSVRILGSDPGVCAAFNGGTHMPFEDVALMRAVPHSTVIDIADGAMLESIMHQIKDRQGLTYYRANRKAYATIYSKDHEFVIGKGNIIREGSDATIIAAGIMLHEAMVAAKELEAEGLSVRVVDMFTIKPLDDELVARCAKETGAIVTAENHNIIGGLGEAVASSMFDTNSMVPMERVGVKDEFGAVGPTDFLQKKFGLTSVEIIAAVKRTVAKKK